MKTDLLREEFLNFFAQKQHKIVPSDSLIPKNDPTLLFTSAGMNQFKEQFLGKITDFRRAASCQRCLRTADLEKVGKTSYHHTFFEMLGNFSFGDYFKEEAILWAWEFLLERLGLKEEDLWVSVYLDDEEAFSIWKDKVGFDASRIIKLGARENFWPSNALEDGPDGPCGPCSEIFFDWGPEVGCRRKECSPACSCGRFVEIWNLVFTQFNRVGFNKVENLPFKNIDTGMGLERMASVLQGVKSNFEIDIFKPIVEEIKVIFSPEEKFNEARLSSIYTIADHIRGVSFAISDGVYPSNEERGYVIRRLIRRAVWFGVQLGRKKPFLYSLVGVVAEVMKRPYPELYDKKEIISKIILSEEERFFSTLWRGKQLLLEVIEKTKREKSKEFSAEAAFKLYDTYGFPYELTRSIVEEEGLSLDWQRFNFLLNNQKEASRKKSKFEEGVFIESELPFRYPVEFTGYETLTEEVFVLAILKEDKLLEEAEASEEVLLVLDKTPFYPTQGGQVSDKGFIVSSESQFKFQVEEVFKVEETIFHKGKILEGRVKEKLKVKARVDEKRRRAIMRAHTSTHLLQSALRKILGFHIQQQGSLVDEDYLRFDFNHFEALEPEILKKIEEEVNSYILADLEVEKKILPFQEAKRQKALAFFEEKYTDIVRMVSIGQISKELCGGTHLNHTSEAGLFMILSEGSVSSGIRRIEALTGEKAYEALSQARTSLKEIGFLLKIDPLRIIERIKLLLKENKEGKKIINNLRRTIFEKIEADRALELASTDIEGVRVVIYEDKSGERSFLSQALDIFRKKVSSAHIFIVFLKEENKLILNISATSDLVKKGFSSKEAALRIAYLLGGSGGGKESLGFLGLKDTGGIDYSQIKEVSLKVFREMIPEILKKEEPDESNKT